MIRPTWASVYSENPANTSAIRENSFFSSAFSEFHGRTESLATATSSGSGLIGVILVPSGITPFSTIRGSTQSR